VIVRQAGADDIPALAGIAERSYRSAFDGILEEPVLRSRDAEFFAARFRDALDRLVLAEADGKPLGFLLVTESHIDMLFLDPDAVGRGAGALLLRHAEKEGATSLECFRDNLHARGFYERHGWALTREYERDFAGRDRAFVLYEKLRR
jgi:putative acetyltransferase